jgi:hypothetical protein
MLQVMGEFSHQICSAEFDAQQNFNTYRSIYTRTAASEKLISHDFAHN